MNKGTNLSEFRRKIQTRLALVLLMLVVVTGFATVGFMLIEGRKPFEAFYMAVVTFTTVGYGDMVPQSYRGRIFAVITIFMGLVGSGVSVALLVDLFFENTLNDILRGRKVGKRILAFRNHHIVCGFGVTGSCIVRSLLSHGQQVVVIEQDLEKTFPEHPKLLVLQGDARKDDMLQAAAIQRAKGLAATLTSDADNVFVVLTARSHNESLEIVSRYKDEDTEKKLYAAGANHAVSPYRMGGQQMFLALTSPTMASLMNEAVGSHSPEVKFSEVEVGETYRRAHANLSAILKWSEDAGVIVVAAFTQDGRPIFKPLPSHPSEKIIRILILGEMANNAGLVKKLS